MSARSSSPLDGRLAAVADTTPADEVAATARRAAAAAARVATASPTELAGWLAAIADAVKSHAEELIALATQDGALGTARLTSELSRMTYQLRFDGGVAALSRFVRPVTYQSAPESTLPDVPRHAAAESNPWQIPRRVDGRMVAP